MDDLIKDIESKRELENDLFDTKCDLFFTDVNMELQQDKDLCNAIDATFVRGLFSHFFCYQERRP